MNDERKRAFDAIIARATGQVTRLLAERKQAALSCVFHGAYELDAKNLVVWYIFNAVADWNAAKQNGLLAQIEQMTRVELLAAGYPADSVAEIRVAFTSDETVRRETGDKPWTYFR